MPDSGTGTVDRELLEEFLRVMRNSCDDKPPPPQDTAVLKLYAIVVHREGEHFSGALLPLL